LKLDPTVKHSQKSDYVDKLSVSSDGSEQSQSPIKKTSSISKPKRKIQNQLDSKRDQISTELITTPMASIKVSKSLTPTPHHDPISSHDFLPSYSPPQLIGNTDIPLRKVHSEFSSPSTNEIPTHTFTMHHSLSHRTSPYENSTFSASQSTYCKSSDHTPRPTQISFRDKESSTIHMSQPNKLQKIHTIDFSQIRITKSLAPMGGSHTRVFGCDVAGFQCVMKEMEWGEYADQNKIDHFLSEISLLQSLSHPNIVKYLHHKRKKETIQLFVSRYECSLRTEIERKKSELTSIIPKFDNQEEILHVLRDIARGLAYLHKNHILHCDIKPDNIFLTFNEHNTIQSAVIGDFDSAERLTSTSTPLNIVGTVNYASPEVLRTLLSLTDPTQSRPQLSFPADIWSFGMVGLEMVTLITPYENVALNEILQQMNQNLPLHSLVSLSKFSGVAMSTIILPCLNINCDIRPTAQHLVDSLHTLMENSHL
jgi:hypothetical protein